MRPSPESELRLEVSPDTVRQLEEQSPDLLDMERRLFDKDEVTALFIRRRAIQLADNLHDREVVARVALEAVTVTKRQFTIDGLNRLWASGNADLPPAA